MTLDGTTGSGVIVWQDQGKACWTQWNAFKELFAGIDAKEPDTMIPANNILL